MEEEDLYQKIKARLIKEIPGVLRVLATAPELEVTVEARVIEADGSTLRGRVARLLAEGWFESPRRNTDVIATLKTRGFSTAPPNVSREMTALAEMGFVLINGDGYRIAPGAKVRILEASARS